VAYDKPILIVDDEAGVVDLLGDYLASKGIASLKCTDPERVMDLIRQNPVEVVVLDFMMPGKDGLVLLKEINELARGAGRPIQVIMLTAQVDSRVALDLLKNDAYLYINKPPKFRDFLKAVHAAIDKYDERLGALSRGEGQDRRRDADQRGRE
jgi:DNA-binding response OmpR family regulator